MLLLVIGATPMFPLPSPPPPPPPIKDNNKQRLKDHFRDVYKTTSTAK